jgi:hypothetical protein
MDAPAKKSPPSFLGRLKSDMRRDKKKMKVLFGLVPLLAVAMIPLLAGGYPSKARFQRAQPIDPVVEPEPVVQVDQVLRAELAGLIREFEDVERPSWSAEEGSGPFASLGPQDSLPDVLAGDAGPSPEASAEEERSRAARLMPTTTFLSSAQKSVAIIGGEPYREGDEIEDFVLAGIGVRSIVLLGRYGEYSLTIPSRDGARE